MSTTTTPEWAAGSAAYRTYLAAADRCRVAFNPVRPVFRVWTSSAGERRRYITNVAEIIGFTYEGRGMNVHGGVLAGQRLSSSQTFKLVQLIESAAFWVDSQRGLHYNRVTGSTSRHHTAETIADAINATRTR